MYDVRYMMRVGESVNINHNSVVISFVAFLGWYDYPRSVHIPMEYIAHGDLGQYLTDHPAKARTEARVISMQTLEGLVVLQKRENCHQDLKPQVNKPARFSPACKLSG